MCVGQVISIKFTYLIIIYFFRNGKSHSHYYKFDLLSSAIVLIKVKMWSYWMFFYSISFVTHLKTLAEPRFTNEAIVLVFNTTIT